MARACVSDVVLRRIAQRPRIRSARLVALDEPADVRDQPVGIVDAVVSVPWAWTVT